MQESTPDPTPSAGVAEPPRPPADPLEALQASLAAVAAPLRELLAARLNQLRVGIRLAIIRALAALALLVVCVALLFGSAVYAGLSIASGVTAATGQPWLGYLAAAILMFGLAVLGLWSMLPRAAHENSGDHAPPTNALLKAGRP